MIMMIGTLGQGSDASIGGRLQLSLHTVLEYSTLTRSNILWSRCNTNKQVRFCPWTTIGLGILIASALSRSLERQSGSGSGIKGRSSNQYSSTVIQLNIALQQTLLGQQWLGFTFTGRGICNMPRHWSGVTKMRT
jgi:hypothetical protein